MGEIIDHRIGAPVSSQLLKTGQTTQYNSKEDDGYFEKGVAKSYTVLSAGQYSGTVDIVLNAKTHALSNNCVKDNKTKLMWARYVPDGDIGPDSDGNLLGIDDTNDEDAYDFQDQANTKKLGGHADWRVPNAVELCSLQDHEETAPCIDSTVFPSTPSSYYWSSSTQKDVTTAGAAVWFSYPRMSPATKTTSKFYCRLVRG